MYWFFKFIYEKSITLGVVLCITGFIVYLPRPWIVKKSKKGKSN